VLRSGIKIRDCRVALLLALPGCLVSFNDYPLGDPRSDVEASGGAGGTGSVLPSGSGAGAKPSGGTNGAGGSSPELMIDDFEDGDEAILPLQGRTGFWYVSNDGQGMQTPRADAPLTASALLPARAGSAHGVHTYGGPFLGWGALLGVNFAASAGTPAPYDLSRYRGVRLWLRSGSMIPNAANKVRFGLLTPGTVVGGSCTVCNDHFAADIALASSWTQVEVPFTSLKQNGFGRPMLAAVDTKNALGLELLFVKDSAFDLWVDDVQLY
jgi:hypothetical protein